MKWFLLIVIIFISGCIGSDTVQSTIKTDEQGFKDVLTVNGIETIPKSPLLPDQDFTLFFTLENLDDEENIKDVEVKLFNPSVFKDQNGNSCAGGLCKTENNLCDSSKKCNLLPFEQKQIQFLLSAPSGDEIADIKLETGIDFSVDYTYTANTFFEIPVVTLNEIEQRQRAGQTLSITGNKIKTSGPIQIEAEIRGSQYVLAGQDANFIFTIINEGDDRRGNLYESEIKANTMTIEFPAVFFTSDFALVEDDCSFLDDNLANEDEFVVEDACNSLNYCTWKFDDKKCIPKHGRQMLPPDDKFTCENNGEKHASISGVICTNKEPIILFKGKSTPLKFTVNKTKDSGIPFATYPIKAKIINYQYQVRDTTRITIEPFK